MRMDHRGKVWLVAVDMGYGHQRALLPLRDLAFGGRVLTANSYEGIPPEDRTIWERSERFYNFVSRLQGKGWLGKKIFGLFDAFQGIPPFYPRPEESPPTLQLRVIYGRIRKGWGRHLIEKLLPAPLPLVTSHFVVAHMAEYWNYPAPVFLIVTDSDVSRAWAPLAPEESAVNYLCPTLQSRRRLEAYGVKRACLYETGFPLPEELVRAAEAGTAVLERLARLDPNRVYEKQCEGLIRQHFKRLPYRSRRPQAPTLTFSIGGAGAQTELARDLFGLSELLKYRRLRLNLMAGASERAASTFTRIVQEAKLESYLGASIRIWLAKTKEEHFTLFNEALRATDILWTKPSELSFYAGLGIPLILAPPVGAHEEKNRDWLIQLGAGIPQEPPRSAGEWLSDWLEAGRLAEAAMNGYLKIGRHGAGAIQRILSKVKPAALAT